MTLQLTALLVAALRVPLSANYPAAGERLAIDLLVAVQVGASAILFPYLLRDWRAAAAIVAGAWPGLAAAAFLSSLTMSRAAVVGAYVTTWLVALAIWRQALRAARGTLVASAVASLWTIGGAMLWYLRAEFVSAGTADGSAASGSPARYGPIMTAIELANGDHSNWNAWIPIALAAAAGAAATLLIRALSARRPVAVAPGSSGASTA